MDAKTLTQNIAYKMHRKKLCKCRSIFFVILQAFHISDKKPRFLSASNSFGWMGILYDLKRQYLLLLNSQFHVINIPTKFYNNHIASLNVQYLITHVAWITSSLSLKPSPEARKKLFWNFFALECATLDKIIALC